ncbi:serine/threonine-protein kinase [Nocardioides yefusunii]|uniref:non-specific serine/threonine protein kinase n=1 Tax=Nocardioides yefusunii TaxID=2500546 RepID=A0ABW1QXR2_9ACTN|nr:serine/threonine-protein kinase [Nocardioides yefusunii]
MTSGRYTFEREIGRGASGAVHLGRDTLLGRDVALKRVGYVPGGTSPEEVRAEREARIAASLTHPHLVGVYDLVHVGDSFWLVMEYVEGTSLSALAKSQGALAPERARKLIGNLADAVAYVHAHGVVHRDVKPSNVLVHAPGTPGEIAKLTDFGIARGEDDRALTKTGLVTGSPAYLSPEVVTGGRATEASDVWAIGATLFHLLAGRAPYDTSENVLSTMYRIVNEPPPRLETDPRLAEVIEHTLVIDPAARWSTQQVRDHLIGRPTRGSRPTSPTPVPATEPAPAAPVPAAATFQTAARERAEAAVARPVWHWVALAGMVTVATVLVLVLALRDDSSDARVDGELASAGSTPTGDASEPTSRKSPRSTLTHSPSVRPDAEVEPSDEPSEEPSPTAEPVTQESLERFARSYLVAAPNDPETAFTRLTPGFQSSSGGFAGYTRWWNQVDSAEVLAVSGDPATLRVSYTVRYFLSSGRTSTESVRLQLVEKDGAFLIAGEG